MLWHQVRVASSAQTALETAVEYQPNVVLLDIGLPATDGYEVARRLRQYPELKKTRLMTMTGYGKESDRQQSVEADFEHRLLKPVDPQTLQELRARLPSNSRHGRGEKTETRGCKVPSDS
jgi:CheY-like chemotaxis protein